MSLRTDLDDPHKLPHLLAARIAQLPLWPAAEALAEKALARLEDVTVPQDARPSGQTWLIAATPEHVASLWELVLAPPPHNPPEHVAILGPKATEALRMAAGLALTSLEVVTQPRLPWSAPVAHARGVHGEQGFFDRSIEGKSFGLAMVLAYASQATDLPVPADLLASAEVRSDGKIAAVDETLLRDKLRLVADDALGITRLLVAPEQIAFCQRVLGGHALHGRPLQIVGPATVAAAIELVFPSLNLQIKARLDGNHSVADATLEALWRAATIRQNELPRWDGVAATAEMLLARYHAPHTTDPAAAARASMVVKIAQRHAHRHGILIDWPDDAHLRALPAPLRACLLAQVVQSATDTSPDTARAYVWRAAPWTRPFGECHPRDLELHGALVRALAAFGDYPNAQQLAVQTLRAWWALDEISGSSHVLCELLRLSALLDDTATLRGLLDHEVQQVLLHREISEISRGYVRLAVGRACVLVRDPDQAAHHLLELLRTSPGVSLRAAGMRWWARCLHAQSKETEADGVRAQLAALAPKEHGIAHQQGLTRLDAAIEAHDESTCNAVLQHLSDDPEIRNLLARCPEDRTQHPVACGRWVANHARY